MAGKKVPFSWILGKDAAAAADALLSEQVKPGYLYCVQHVAFENATNASTRMRIAVRAGARDVLIAEEKTLSAATLYFYDVPFYIAEGERLAVLLTGLTGGDDLMCYVTGWYQAPGNGI